MKQKLNIMGMTCSACSKRVSNALNKQEGVKSANVNLLQNTALVEFDEKVCSLDEIIKAVDNAGYHATVFTTTVKDDGIKWRLLSSILLLIPLVYLSSSKMFGLPLFNFLENNKINYLFQMILALSLSIINYRYFVNGFKHLIKRDANMDSLIAMSATFAFLYGIYILVLYFVSEASVDPNYDAVYFESVGMVLVFVTIGKFIEGNSKGKTTEAISKLLSLAPEKANILVDGKEVEVKTSEIKIDDIVIIKDGDLIPVDGIIIDGNGTLDEANITGEATYIDKTVGDEVLKSTVNHSGYFQIKASRVGNDTTYDKIIALVDEASSSKAPISRLVDRISNIFVPLVMATSLITFIVWLIITANFSISLSYAITVLVVSCPCALGLATPTAIMVATLKAAENHCLIKSAQSLEEASIIDYVLLDKTGTITTGKPDVKKVITNGISEEVFIKYAVSLENLSTHPLAVAIKEKYANVVKEQLFEVSSYQNIPGRGIMGIIEGKQIISGNYKFMKENISSFDFENNDEVGSTTIYFAYDLQFIGAIIMSDVIKPSSQLAIDSLKKMNIKTAIISGDNINNVKTIANEMAIDEYYGEVFPDDKDKIVLEKQKLGHKVSFIGDGINDAVALTRADVAIAIGCGTDVAIECADVVLVRNDLLDAVDVIRLSKKTMTIIKENLFWAFFYNLLLIPIAAGVLSSIGIVLKPGYAAIAMCISSITVVLNALRIKKFKKICKTEETSCYINGGIIVNKYQYNVKIEGMMCEHCKMHVEKALSTIENVSAKVDLQQKMAFIESTLPLDEKVIIDAVTNAGYNVLEIMKVEE